MATLSGSDVLPVRALGLQPDQSQKICSLSFTHGVLQQQINCTQKITLRHFILPSNGHDFYNFQARIKPETLLLVRPVLCQVIPVTLFFAAQDGPITVAHGYIMIHFFMDPVFL